jgi:hypothetical protein
MVPSVVSLLARDGYDGRSTSCGGSERICGDDWRPIDVEDGHKVRIVDRSRGILDISTLKSPFISF